MQIINEGLIEEETECWTEIPNSSVRIEPAAPENIQHRTICPC